MAEDLGLHPSGLPGAEPSFAEVDDARRGRQSAKGRGTVVKGTGDAPCVLHRPHGVVGLKPIDDPLHQPVGRAPWRSNGPASGCRLGRRLRLTRAEIHRVGCRLGSILERTPESGRQLRTAERRMHGAQGLFRAVFVL